MAVYFAITEDANYVKIGYSKEENVERRINKIQIGCPFYLSVVHIIEGADIYEEHKLHNEFRKQLVRGEWFLYEPVISSYLENLKKGEQGGR